VSPTLGAMGVGVGVYVGVTVGDKVAVAVLDGVDVDVFVGTLGVRVPVGVTTNGAARTSATKDESSLENWESTRGRPKTIAVTKPSANVTTSMTRILLPPSPIKR